MSHHHIHLHDLTEAEAQRAIIAIMPELNALKHMTFLDPIAGDDVLVDVLEKLIMALYRVVGLAHNDLEGAPRLTAEMLTKLAETARFGADRPAA